MASMLAYYNTLKYKLKGISLYTMTEVLKSKNINVTFLVLNCKNTNNQ